MEIKDIGGLIHAYYNKHPEGHYFDKKTLAFFGESLDTMRLLKKRVDVIDSLGKRHKCYVISRLQKKHPDGPQTTYAYFDMETLDDIHGTALEEV